MPVLLLAGLALASAIAGAAACAPIHAAGSGLYLADAGQGDRLESEEPLESASPDLYGSREACDAPRRLAEALPAGLRQPRPFSVAGDRPRARLPDPGVGLYPAPGSPRLLTTFRSDRLLPTRLDGGAVRGSAS